MYVTCSCLSQDDHFDKWIRKYLFWFEFIREVFTSMYIRKKKNLSN